MSFLFLTTLTVKATVLSVAAILCLFFLRRSPAHMRHLLCRGFFSALLSLPVLMLVMPAWLPESAVPFWLHSVSRTSVISAGHAPFLAWQAVVMAVWAAGIAFALARMVLGFVLLKLELRRGGPFADADWESDLADASDKLTVNPHLIRLSLGGLNSPLTFGLQKPVILLPQESARWNSLSRQAVLLHEVAHIRRSDWLWNCLAQIALAAFWFHPLMWALYGELRRTEELACDDDVLGCGIPPAAYASVLLEMTRNLPSRFLLANAMSGEGDAAHLRARFRHILQRPQSRSANSQAGKMALGFLLLVLAGCTASAPNCITSATTSLDTRHLQAVEKIGGDVSKPILLSKVEPEYTEAAKKDKVQGTTLLNVTIGKEGTPTNIHVLRPLRPDLDANAISAVTHWRFTPATHNGAPVPVAANIEINFKLR